RRSPGWRKSRPASTRTGKADRSAPPRAAFCATGGGFRCVLPAGFGLGGDRQMSDWTNVTRPVPVPNEWTRPFWAAAKRESLELQRCQSCGHFQHPPYATCTQCVSTDLKFEPVRGAGAIYAYTIMYHTGDKRFASAVPYASII